MKKFFLLVFLPFLLAGSFTLCADFMVNEAEAARFGGGRSFGGSRSYRQPAPAPARQQVAPAQNAAAPRSAATAAGRGGFFGPLLAGSMLGALFFGGGFHGFGLADAAVLMLGVLLLSRFIRSRRRAAELAAAEAGPGAGHYDARQTYRDSNAPNPWDRLRGGAAAGSGPDGWTGRTGQTGRTGAADETGETSESGGLAEPGPRLPDGFDAQEFLDGAKVLFTRLQEAWDQRDLDDIAEFASASVLEEIARQAEEDPAPSQTDILLINARLTGFNREGAGAAAVDTASVYFEVLLRERAGQESSEMREFWHFTRRGGAGWKLDGIQQAA